MVVEAEGANLSYQWLCRAPGSSNFEYLTGETSPTLRVEMTAASNGAEYRCFITDANGDMGSTRVATIKLDILDWVMEYNTSGIRTQRVSEDKTYSYIYAGDKLMRMTVGNDTLDFSYDTNGVPLTMTYNGTVYYYITNLQGDVMKLERADGGSGAQYAYDAWGNIVAMTGHLAELNPLRYRGYVYDQETGFYYLNSRYYDPAVGRFISADDFSNLDNFGGLLRLNIFSYCSNDPVSREDESGEMWLLSIAIGLGTQYAGDVIGNIISGKKGVDIFIPTSSVGDYIAAGVTALIPGSGIGGALVRNIVAEGIKSTEAIIKGNGVSLTASIKNVAFGTLLDAGFEKVTDKALNAIKSKTPVNYSSYAGKVRTKLPNMTKAQIEIKMRRAIRMNRIVSDVFSFAMDIGRTVLPY